MSGEPERCPSISPWTRSYPPEAQQRCDGPQGHDGDHWHVYPEGPPVTWDDSAFDHAAGLALDLYRAAQLARARHLEELCLLVNQDRRHRWRSMPDGWDCTRCDAGLSDLAPLDEARRIVAQACVHGPRGAA